MTTSVIVAGSSGLGRLSAERFAARGDDVVVVSSRDPELAAQAAVEIGGWVRGLAVDLTRPHDIAGELTSVDSVDKLHGHPPRGVRARGSLSVAALAHLKL